MSMDDTAEVLEIRSLPEEPEYEQLLMHKITRWFMRGVLVASFGTFGLFTARAYGNSNADESRNNADLARACATQWSAALEDLLTQYGELTDGEHSFVLPSGLIGANCRESTVILDEGNSTMHAIEGTFTVVDGTVARIASGRLIDDMLNPQELQSYASDTERSADISTTLWALGGAAVGGAIGLGFAEGFAFVDKRVRGNNAPVKYI